MIRLLTIAAAITLLTAAQTFACDPKRDPGCNFQPELNIEIACNPKTDPGCNFQPELNIEIACNPKTDPGCDFQPELNIELSGTVIGNGLEFDFVNKLA